MDAKRLDQLMAKTVQAGECRIWTGAVHSSGYPWASIDGNNIKLPKILYEFRHGPVPPGKQLRHICGNRLCLEDKHIVPGTGSENMMDDPEWKRVYRSKAGGEGIARKHRKHRKWIPPSA